MALRISRIPCVGCGISVTLHEGHLEEGHYETGEDKAGTTTLPVTHITTKLEVMPMLQGIFRLRQAVA